MKPEPLSEEEVARVIKQLESGSIDEIEPLSYHWTELYTKFLRAGVDPETVSTIMAVKHTDVLQWIEDGEASDDPSSPEAQFASEFERALAQSKAAFVSTIYKAAVIDKDPRWAAWWLEKQGMVQGSGRTEKVPLRAPGGPTMSSGEPASAYRSKVRLRRRLLRKAQLEMGTVAYVPFVGHGHIAQEMYKRHRIIGADIDPGAANIAVNRLPESSTIKVADCETWPFPEERGPVTIADFDAYTYPYGAFRQFWDHAPKDDTLVMFFSDGQKASIQKLNQYRHPAGKLVPVKTNLATKREKTTSYYKDVVFPWFEETIPPYSIVEHDVVEHSMMIYWGVIIRQ
jgi:hypothetical protein